MSLIEPLLTEMEQEATSTRRLLERVPSDKLGWKPHAARRRCARRAGRGFALSTYLRALDVPLPSVYGPTADENPFLT